MNESYKEGKITKHELINAPVGYILINQEALRAFNATSQKLHKVFVLNATDQVYLIEELIYPLPGVEN